MSTRDLPAGLIAPSPRVFRIFQAIWVANAGDNSVKRIDATTKVVTDTVSGFSGPHGICSDGRGGIWVANRNANNVKRIDATTKVVTNTVSGFSIPVGYGGDAGSEV